jgi:hypothetical protein
MQATALKAVEINKEGRFWAVKTDGELLAMVLYKNGAKAVQRRLQQLAGLPVEGEEVAEAPQGKAGKSAKKSDKSPTKGKSAGKKPAKLAETVEITDAAHVSA